MTYKRQNKKSPFLPSLTDKWRTKRNGEKRYIGQILDFSSGNKRVVAEVYGDTLEEMRKRKKIVFNALTA